MLDGSLRNPPAMAPARQHLLYDRDFLAENSGARLAAQGRVVAYGALFGQPDRDSSHQRAFLLAIERYSLGAKIACGECRADGVEPLEQPRWRLTLEPWRYRAAEYACLGIQRKGLSYAISHFGSTSTRRQSR